MQHLAPRALEEGEALRDFLARQERKSFLRFLTCGSVDDGKSTLIGRLLYDTKLIFEDQLAALERDSRVHGTTGDDMDFALLVDGLEAEREQGITIDVAYRFFATSKRKFIVADTPGHEQYTRNMATGASTADLAIVLVDARKGMATQTRRHSYIASLLGIRHIVLAVNKIDLVDFSEERFRAIADEYSGMAAQLGFASVRPIPISARYGDNVTSRSPRTSWYDGPALLDYLETIDVAAAEETRPFRFPVQYVNRPNHNFRGFAGTIAAGSVAVGDEVVVAKSGRSSRISRIVAPEGDLARAGEGEAVTLVLDDEVEVSRGNMLVAPDHRPHVADQLAANIVWFDEQALIPGRSYLLRTETDMVPASVTEVKWRVDVNTYAQTAAKTLSLNEVGVCNLSLQAPVAFDAYADNPTTGAFVLIDRITNRTAGAGMILNPLRRASNVHWHVLDIDRNARSAALGQQPAVLWLTGLSGSGKSTIANLLERKLHAEGRHTYVLDGDNVRHGLNRDLGFSETDRVENIRRVAEVARLMADAGLIVIVSFISPFAADRRMARELMNDIDFAEVFIDTPLEECMRRDPKGLYAKAQRGELKNFTGIDQPYETPEKPDIHIRTAGRAPEEMVEEIERWLAKRVLSGQEYDDGAGI
ncbi:sulfate adenylyltransferase subunit CysN [Nitratireductor mangrovi]|uniref:Multifunctional fusion protein n=1 Tax=Nitratireductor mangrovi TaxID=2599600 RepID=A0A5B8KZP6_9HYPH|nr:sulfate adenylyltransferase subunit CysN [Nitratireductor mangrovi]QDZ01053.1 sulfate adenylyltransferase subunit CysN [Nitratireductor mangrovi]